MSVLFWYVGMIPDLATMRDRFASVGQERSGRRLYGLFAMGWRGSSRHWSNYEMAYLILAGISTPLVLSVHTIVSFDFAVSLMPGWHTTIFPPYFVAGAIFSGFGMVLTLILPLRAIYQPRGPDHAVPHRLHVQDHLGDRHDGGLRVRDGVLHRVVRRESLRGLHVHQPRVRPVLVGLLDHGHLQRRHPAVLLVQGGASRTRRSSGSSRSS